ncbi:MAG: preprotein translocase subunit YajC [Verrucomicrobiota bacterium]|nr:preprotein translocase subunit YajC [Verrucomicrobiota bacterium]
MNSFALWIGQAAAEGVGGLGGGFGGMFIPVVLLFGIFYFMAIRPQQRKEKERRAMIENVKTGERVLFGGGIIGTIANVKEHTFIVKVADNVKIEVARAAVTKVLEKGEKPTDETDGKKK